ncbi:GerMN domain-containing protein [Longispora sp. NPDC051575]|uniref:GerMN domain-containing protein n=1 Tax=Longispora sp. NPDC051575 TaxID=3154943 RepID=UPI00341CD48C
MTRPIIPATVLLLLGMLAGCGVGAEDTARPIQPPRGPYQALTTPSPQPSTTGSRTQTLYLVRAGKLTPVERPAPEVPTAETLLRDLVAGPTTAEADSGLTSALWGGSVISGVRVTDGQAVVTVTAALDAVSRNDEILAFGQVVCTLTARDDVNGVVFTRDRQRIAVPRGDASLSQGPLTATDYTSLIAGR